MRRSGKLFFHHWGGGGLAKGARAAIWRLCARSSGRYESVDRTRGSRGDSGRLDDQASDEAIEIAGFLARSHSRARASDSIPALSSWMRQMERYPQLEAAEQGELAAQYQAGLAAQRQLDDGSKLSLREERRLRDAVLRGARAIEYLSASNFRLVILISREKAEARYGRERAGEMLADLVGHANITLIEAAQSFNPNAGPSFPTYVAGKIRHKMIMVLNQEHPIRVPPSWTRMKRIVSVRGPALVAELGRNPTREELEADLFATCMAWAYDKLSENEKALPVADREQRQIDRLRKQGMLGALERLDDVLLQTQSLMYLDAPMRDEGSTMADILADDDEDYSSSLARDEMREAVLAALSTLPEREQEIVLLRYGFKDGEFWPYHKISLRFNVSAERIRQIEKVAISKLAHLPGLSEHLGS